MKKLILTVGLPGSGKTTYLRNFLAFKNHIIISPDLIREELTGDISDQSQNKKVWDLAYERLNFALESDYEYIGFDATLIKPQYRNEIYKRLNNIECEVTALIFSNNLHTALSRNSSRNRVVPTDIIQKMEREFIPIGKNDNLPKNFSSIYINEPYDLPNRGKTAFVGDIHSCYEALESLLNRLGFWREGNQWYNSFACEEIIFLGDGVDRGSDSVNTLKTIIQLSKKGWARMVLGNHDSKLFRYLKSIKDL